MYLTFCGFWLNLLFHIKKILVFKHHFGNNHISKCYFNYSILNDKKIIAQICSFFWFGNPSLVQWHELEKKKTRNKVLFLSLFLRFIIWWWNNFTSLGVINFPWAKHWNLWPWPSKSVLFKCKHHIS